MRLILIFVLGLGLAASAAHSHDFDAIANFEFPIPQVVEVRGPVSAEEAIRLSKTEEPSSGQSLAGLIECCIGRNVSDYDRHYFYNLVIANEAAFFDALDAIQEEQNCFFTENDNRRFVPILEWDWVRGGVGESFRSAVSAIYTWPFHAFKRGSWPIGIAYLFYDADLTVANLSTRFRFTVRDMAGCGGYNEHTVHPDGSRHAPVVHSSRSSESYYHGEYSDWVWIADILTPASQSATEEPVVVDPGPVEPEAEAPADNSAELARLRAANDALRDSLRAAGVGAAALRGALLALQAQIDALQAADGATTITLIDTVEVARVDTVHFCPPTDEDRQDLFDAFTGLQDSTAAAPKAAAVQVES